MRFRKCAVVLTFLAAVAGAAFASGTTEQGSAPAAKPDLRFLWQYAPFDLTKDPGIAVMEAGTGYKVTWDTVPEGQQGQEKVILKLSSGEKYDLVQVLPDTFPIIIKHQIAMPLDKLLQQYGANITDQLPADAMKVGKWDGTQYGLPRVADKQMIVEKGLILARKDVLDKLGLAAPTTIQQLYTDLKAIKEKMPDSIPLSFEADQIPAFILSGFGLTGGWQKVDGKWMNDIKRPEYPQMVTFLHTLYHDGLLDQDMPAMTRDDRWQRFTSGKAIIIRYDAGDYYMFDALHKNVPDAQYEYLPVLKDTAGKGRVLASGGYNAVSFIPKDASHPADAIKWINTTVDPTNFRNLYIGTEGTTFKIVDGGYVPIFPAFNDFNKRYWYFAVYGAKAPTYWKARVHKSPLTAESYLTIQKQNADYAELTPLAYAPQFQAETQYSQVVTQYAHDEVLKFIAGTRNLDEWSQFLSELDQKGEAAIDKEVGAWLEANE